MCVCVFWLVSLLPPIKKQMPCVKRPVWPVWPVCLLLCISILSFTRVPKGLGLWVSMREFDKFIRDEKPTSYKRNLREPPGPTRMQLGAYPIYDYAVIGDGAAYLVTDVDNDFINTDISGFAYRPSREMRYRGRIGRSFLHLWGDWYTFEETEFF
jgi:hypothetical protein